MFLFLLTYLLFAVFFFLVFFRSILQASSSPNRRETRHSLAPSIRRSPQRHLSHSLFHSPENSLPPELTGLSNLNYIAIETYPAGVGTISKSGALGDRTNYNAGWAVVKLIGTFPLVSHGSSSSLFFHVYPFRLSMASSPRAARVMYEKKLRIRKHNKFDAS